MNAVHITTLILKTGEELPRNFIWITANLKAGPICHRHFSQCLGCQGASSRDILMPSICMHIFLEQRKECIRGFLLLILYKTERDIILFTWLGSCAGNYSERKVHFPLYILLLTVKRNKFFFFFQTCHFEFYFYTQHSILLKKLLYMMQGGFGIKRCCHCYVFL